MPDPIRVLIIEDKSDDAELVIYELTKAGFKPDWKRVDLEPDYIAALETNPVLILADWSLPQFSGKRALQIMQKRGLDIPFIIVSGSMGEDIAIEAMRQGAADYLLKDRLTRLGQAVRRALEDKKLRDERNLAEEELLRQAQIMDQVGEGIVATDLNGLIVSWNLGAEKQLGYTAEEALGRPITFIYPQDQLSFLTNEIQPQVRKKGWHEADVRFRSKSGKEIPVHLILTTLKDSKGKVVGMTGSATDITERKRAEEALSTSESKFRNLIEQSSDGIAIIDENGIVVDWNEQEEQITGIKQEKALGRPLWDIQSQIMPGERKKPEMRSRLQKSIMEILENNDTPWTRQGMETEIQRPDGTHRTVMMTMYRFNTGKGFMAGSIARDITHSKLAEEALRESEDKFKYVFDHSVAGKSFTMVSGELNVNQAFADMLGYSAEELNHLKWQEITHPEDVELTLNANKALLDGRKESMRFTKRFFHKNGSIVWADVATALRRDKDRKPVYFMTTFLDITERKLAEKKLSESEERFRSLYENATIGMYRTSLKGQILMANPALVRMLGYESFEELSLRDLASEGYEPAYPRQEFQERMEKEGEVRGLESAWKRKDKSIISVRESAHLVRDEKNQPQYYEGTVEDITDRKQAEDALRRSEAELRALFASMNDVVMEIDQEGIYRKVAPTNPGLLIKPPEDLVGKPLEEVFPPEQTEDFINVIQKVLETKQTTAIEYSLPVGGRTVQFETAISPLTEDSTLWVARDITERKLAEERIIQLNAELEKRVDERTRELREAQEKIVRQEKLAVLGQLAGGVGHELRNPLGIISNAIYYLKMIQPDAEEKVREYHSMIAREVRVSEKIITDLMDFSRLESMERCPVAVPELVQWTLMRFAVPESIQTRINLPEDLPEVFVDMGQMQQVLGNLVVNAAQALAPQGSSSEIAKGSKITISARKLKGKVAIAVIDNGVGITPENMERIFEPLFTTKAKGIGLGLAVSKKLAEANGGRIEVKSAVGKGSTFTLYLPVKGI